MGILLRNNTKSTSANLYQNMPFQITRDAWFSEFVFWISSVSETKLDHIYSQTYAAKMASYLNGKPLIRPICQHKISGICIPGENDIKLLVVRAVKNS